MDRKIKERRFKNRYKIGRMVRRNNSSSSIREIYRSISFNFIFHKIEKNRHRNFIRE